MKMFSDSPCQLNFRLLATRKGSGLVVCETRENPLHGIHVLRACPLVVGDGVKSEDPHLRFDAAAGLW